MTGLSGERIVVTGASGLIGFPVAKALAPDNDVTAVARFNDERDVVALQKAGARVVRFDLADPDLSALPESADVVFHFGAMTAFPADAAQRAMLLEVNTQATGRIAMRYRGCRSFVYASSGSVYKFQGERRITEDDSYGMHNGLETYAASKIASEQLLHFLSREYEIPVVMLRIFSTYGPRGGAVTGRVERVRAGKPILLYPGVTNNYCPMYETDYVEKAIASASIASVPPETINFAGSEICSLEEYCTIAGEILGKEPIFEESADALYPIWPETSKMERLIGKTSVSTREGIRKVLESDPGERFGRWATWVEPAD